MRVATRHSTLAIRKKGMLVGFNGEHSGKTWIPIAEPFLTDLEKRYVAEAMESGWISSLGPFLRRFEDSFAHSTGTSSAVSVSNGTAALELSLAALNVGAGDEVIVPAHTFAAVPAVVVRAGAIPVFVDVEPNYWCIDPEAAVGAITDRTRAIIAVHSYGHPADLASMLDAAERLGIAVVEDCAEALGARYRGSTVGSLGTTGAFSFYANKIITTGEGGMITTNSPGIAERLRFLRDHAMEPGRRYFHSAVGYNARLTNIQAAIGCGQLERLAELLQRRAEILEIYRQRLKSVPGLTINPVMPWAEPVNWMVSVLLPPECGAVRERVMRYLAGGGVDSRPFFIALTELPPYARYRRVGRSGEDSTPVAFRLARYGINLPSSPRLTDGQVEGICDAFLAALHGSAEEGRR